MENHDQLIMFKDWPEGTTDAQKDLLKNLMRRRADEMTSVCIVYHPNCGCEVDQFVLLDRFPMSPKIIATCPACDKGCLMEISDPIRFHIDLNDQDFSLEELKKMHVAPGRQEQLLKQYQSCELYE